MNAKDHNFIDIKDFQKVILKVGTIIKVENFAEARKPSYKIWLDFGSDVIKKSSAQITDNYTINELIGKQVICVTNLKPRQIGNFMSEILITGFPDDKGNVILAVPEHPVTNGKILY